MRNAVLLEILSPVYGGRVREGRRADQNDGRVRRSALESQASLSIRSLTRGFSPAGQVVEEPRCDVLVQRPVVVAALGRLYAGRATVGAWALRHRVERRRQQLLDDVEPVLGDADPAGVAVVDEHLRLARVGVHGRGHAADVVAVAESEERQDAYRCVLDRVQTPREVPLARRTPTGGWPGERSNQSAVVRNT